MKAKPDHADLDEISSCEGIAQRRLVNGHKHKAADIAMVVVILWKVSMAPSSLW